MSDKATIKIPRNLYNNLHEIIEDTGFNSVTEFIVYVMRDLVSTTNVEQNQTSRSQNKTAGNLSSTEIELIRKRLKSLGYLE